MATVAKTMENKSLVPPQTDISQSETKEEEKTDVIASGEPGYVSSMIHKGYDSYTWGKTKALESKMLASTLQPSLNYIESKLYEAKGLSPYPVENVVNALDSRVDNVVRYSQSTIDVMRTKPVEMKNSTLKVLHENLGKLKTDIEVEQKEQEKEEQEPSFIGIYSDMKQITSEGASKLLDVSEKFVEKYLPPAPEEGDEESKDEAYDLESNQKSNAIRAVKLSKLVTKRMQRRALSRLSQLKLRTKSVVHVDLVKYSEMLDMDSKKVWFNEKSEEVKNGVGKNVVEPLRKMGNEVGHRYGDLREKAKEYQQIARDRVVHIKVPFSDDVLRIWTVVGDTCNERIVKPCEQIVETFRQELHKQQEIVKNQEADPNKPLTIEAGLRAVIAAARYRLKKEWETRVAPGLEEVLARSPFAKKDDGNKPESNFKVGLEDDESDESTEPVFDAQE